MKIYLDMCSIQRPLDTKTQPRIAVEAEAILGVLTLCEAGQVELMTSDTLVFELERNPHSVRKEYALKVLAKARVVIPTDSHIEEGARSPLRPTGCSVYASPRSCSQLLIAAPHWTQDSIRVGG